MARETRLLTGGDVLAPELSAAWDELPLGRADLADLYDTHTWLSAWSAAAPEDEIGLLRVPVLYDGDRLVAALPLTLRAWGRWESAGIDRRPRWRPVLGWPHPDEEALELLVEEAARRGAREFSLVAMPARDPATEALERALGQAGFAAVRTGAATECLALVAGGWAGHRARFKKFDRTARNFWNKAERLGPVALRTFGGPGAPPVSAGFDLYLDLHRRGWKGELKGTTVRHRRALLEGTQRRGWARLYVLDVAGVPAAAMVWFRVGDVAIAYSTVYDQRLAAISAGTVAMWRSIERVFAEQEPKVVDLLPGYGPQKDQLGPDRTPLVTINAKRGRAIAGWAGPLARRAGILADRALNQARRLAPTRREEPARSRATVVDGRRENGLTATAAELDPRTELLVALAGGHASPAAAAAGWQPGDRWIRVANGVRALALVRVAAAGPDPLPAREIILAPGPPLDPFQRILTSVAALLECRVSADLPAADGIARAPVPVRVSSFPLDAGSPEKRTARTPELG